MSSAVLYVGCPGGCKNFAKLLADSMGADFIVDFIDAYRDTNLKDRIKLYLRSNGDKRFLITGCGVGGLFSLNNTVIGGLFSLNNTESCVVTESSHRRRSKNFILGGYYCAIGNPLPSFPVEKFLRPSVSCGDRPVALIYDSWWVPARDVFKLSRFNPVKEFMGGGDCRVEVINSLVNNSPYAQASSEVILLSSSRAI